MTKKQLTLGSLFDGSGGFPLGGMLCGIKTLWASEIEPFPIRVTTKRLPGIKHYGDINKLDGAKLEPVDIISFSSPCQGLSGAGLRKGLADERSNLFFQAIRVIKEMREKTNGKYPRYIVWENVSGARSSNKGKDFQQVLEQICSIKDSQISIPEPDKGKWLAAGEIVGDSFSVAWRQVDAVGWGVPQRRKRIYLVADFASRGGAGKVLFESEGVSRYSPQDFRTWQDVTRDSENCPGNSSSLCLNDEDGSRFNISNDLTGTLRAEMHGHQPIVLHEKESDQKNYLFENHGQDARYTGPLEAALTVWAGFGTGGTNRHFVVSENPYLTYILHHGGFPFWNKEVSPTLTVRDYKDPCVINQSKELLAGHQEESHKIQHDVRSIIEAVFGEGKQTEAPKDE